MVESVAEGTFVGVSVIETWFVSAANVAVARNPPARSKPNVGLNQPMKFENIWFTGPIAMCRASAFEIIAEPARMARGISKRFEEWLPEDKSLVDEPHHFTLP
jgi:hypothetical protein